MRSIETMLAEAESALTKLGGDLVPMNENGKPVTLESRLQQTEFKIKKFGGTVKWTESGPQYITEKIRRNNGGQSEFQESQDFSEAGQKRRLYQKCIELYSDPVEAAVMADYSPLIESSVRQGLTAADVHFLRTGQRFRMED